MRGDLVQFKSSGNSLWPLVHSGDICWFTPNIPGCEIKVGDIVFCHVQPKDRYYCHLVWKASTYIAENGVDKRCFVIGNNKPAGQGQTCNGWCPLEKIYGILTKTQRGPHIANVT